MSVKGLNSDKTTQERDARRVEGSRR